PQKTIDGEAKQQKTKAGDNHGCRIERDRKSVQLLFEHIGRKEWQQREAEEKTEVGIKDALISLLDSMHKMVVIDPVDAGEAEGDQIDNQRGQYSAKSGKTLLVRNFKLEHHDGDDHSDHSIGESFQAGCRGELIVHSCLTRCEAA